MGWTTSSLSILLAAPTPDVLAHFYANLSYNKDMCKHQDSFKVKNLTFSDLRQKNF